MYPVACQPVMTRGRVNPLELSIEHIGVVMPDAWTFAPRRGGGRIRARGEPNGEGGARRPTMDWKPLRGIRRCGGGFEEDLLVSSALSTRVHRRTWRHPTLLRRTVAHAVTRC
jgi:hypothetical protein